MPEKKKMSGTETTSSREDLEQCTLANYFRTAASQPALFLARRSWQQGPGMFKASLAPDLLLTCTWWLDDTGDNRDNRIYCPHWVSPPPHAPTQLTEKQSPCPPQHLSFSGLTYRCRASKHLLSSSNFWWGCWPGTMVCMSFMEELTL